MTGRWWEVGVGQPSLWLMKGSNLWLRTVHVLWSAKSGSGAWHATREEAVQLFLLRERHPRRGSVANVSGASSAPFATVCMTCRAVTI